MSMDKGKGKADAEQDMSAAGTGDASASPAAAAGSLGGEEKRPHPLEGESPKATCIICIGMAGSGKTTFIHRLTSYLHGQKKPPYVLNLDPAVVNLGYEANIDIRDTVDYKQVMQQYNLGPNGGILTALNLFTTKFDQVLGYVDKKAHSGSVEHILLDTPGQIEIFTWSASGAIITDALASSLPTVVAYIIDTPRTASPETFMSNMLYACSILYKTKLPFILVFNKTDVHEWAFAKEWMEDFEAFQAALMRRRDKQNRDVEGTEGGFMTSLMSSMSLVLEEFYKNLRACGVSAMTGDGMEDFFIKVDEARQEYEDLYKPELLALHKEREQAKEAEKADSMARMMRDMKMSVPLQASGKGKAASGKPKTREELLAELEEQDRAAEEEDQERGYDEDEEGVTIDREDHGMYKSMRAEHARRAGPAAAIAAAGRRTGQSVVDDGLGGRWPAPR